VGGGEPWIELFSLAWLREGTFIKDREKTIRRERRKGKRFDKTEETKNAWGAFTKVGRRKIEKKSTRKKWEE